MRKWLLFFAVGGVSFVQGSIPKFNVIATTRFLTPAKMDGGALKIEVPELDINAPEKSLQKVLNGIQKVLKKPQVKKRYTFHVYHTSHMTPAEIVQLKSYIITEYQAVMNGGEPHIVFHYTGRPGVTPETMFQALEESIDRIREQEPPSEARERKIEIEHRINREVFERNRSWLSRVSQPHLTTKVILGFASVRASITGMMRFMQVYNDPNGFDTDAGVTGELAAQVSLIVIDTVKDFLTVYYQASIGRWFLEHGLAPDEHIRRDFWKRVNDVYKNNLFAQFAKVATLNFMLHALTVPLSMQALGHMGGLSGIGLPTWTDAGQNALRGFIGTLCFAGAYCAAQMARIKGLISQNKIDLSFQFPGLIDSAANVVTSIPSLRWVAFTVQVPQWLFYVGSLGVAALAPYKNRQILLVEHNDANSRELAEKNHSTLRNSTITLPLDEGVLKMVADDLAAETTLRPAGSTEWCVKRILREAYQTVRDRVIDRMDRAPAEVTERWRSETEGP